MDLILDEIISTNDLGHTQMLLHANGIIEAVCSDNFVYEVEHLNENLECIIDWSKSEKKLMLNSVAPYTSITAEARKYIANSPHLESLIAEAFVIHSLAHRLLASFFIKIDKPKLPTKFFNKREEAIEWLLSFK
jgi:hypothetical protein